jgi:hypothetical protein
VAREVAERGAARDEDQAPAPARLEFSTVHELRAADRWILHQRLVVHHLAEHEETAVMAFDDCRQRRLRQPLPARAERTCFQLERLCAAQHLGDAERSVAELLANLRRISRDLMKAQQQHESIDAARRSVFPVRAPHLPPRPHRRSQDVKNAAGCI